MKRLVALVIVILVVLSGVVYGQHTRHKPQIDTPTPTPSLSASEIIRLVNVERAKVGVPALTTAPELMQSSSEKCNDMRDNHYYAHDNPTTGMHGYEYIQKDLPAAKDTASENLAQIASDNNSDVINEWLGSSDHKAAMLDPKYTLTGVAVCYPVNAIELTMIVQHFAYIPTAVAQPSQPVTQTVVQQPIYQPAPYHPVRCTTNYQPSIPWAGTNPQAFTTCY